MKTKLFRLRQRLERGRRRLQTIRTEYNIYNIQLNKSDDSCD